MLSPLDRAARPSGFWIVGTGYRAFLVRLSGFRSSRISVFRQAMRTIDQLMSSIEETAAQRRTAARPIVSSSIESELRRAPIAADAVTPVTSSQAFGPSFPGAGRRHVDDFLRLSNEAFINEAYTYVLGRPPDEAGLWHLRQLASGSTSKLKVLHLLVRSDEAKARNAPKIAGFEFRYRLSAAFWRNVARYCLHTPRRLAHMRALRRNAVTQAASSAAEQPASSAAEQPASSAAEQPASSATETPVNPEVAVPLLSKVGQLGVALGQNVERTMEMREQLDRLEALAESKLRHLAKEVEMLRDQLETNRHHADRASGTSTPGQDVSVRSAGASHSGYGESGPISGFESFYAEFEGSFRGTRADIKNRQKLYLTYLKTEDAELQRKPVLDLGCGRGEWIELLVDYGIAAIGIDANAQFVHENEERGLAVVCADALAFLQAQPDGSARAISGFHIIEHLPFAVLVAVLDESYRVLAPGGIAIFETPNPENLITAAHKFYFDPTHIRPIPPTFAAYLIENRGFAQAEIIRLHESTEPERNEIDNAFLRGLLFGPQDYGVIGRKRTASE
jgi:SAM-dependent methyltransferase